MKSTEKFFFSISCFSFSFVCNSVNIHPRMVKKRKRISFHLMKLIILISRASQCNCFPLCKHNLHRDNVKTCNQLDDTEHDTTRRRNRGGVMRNREIYSIFIHGIEKEKIIYSVGGRERLS